jgi:stage II sporulation protein R
MKLVLKSLSIGLILTLLFTFIPFEAQCENISNELFRLHILANSDSEADQELKLCIRNKILNYTENLFEGCTTKEETIKITKENLSSIINVAQNEVYRLGYSYKVTGEIKKMYFNTRTYGKYTVPSGFYDALRITIGEGKGHNWWCVMYPSFCIGESSDIENSNLSVDDKKIISDDENYKIKFQVIEWYEKLLSYF